MRLRRFDIAILTLFAVFAASLADAQQLWKYVDKDGKVTYSDKPPRKDEKAEEVKNDPKANVIESHKVPAAAPAKGTAGSAATPDRAKARDDAMKNVDAARASLDAAKKALEAGKEPQAGETQIIVGRTGEGKPTGINSVMRKPEYYERVKALEDAVTAAEKNLEEAEKAYGKAK